MLQSPGKTFAGGKSDEIQPLAGVLEAGLWRVLDRPGNRGQELAMIEAPVAEDLFFARSARLLGLLQLALGIGFLAPYKPLGLEPRSIALTITRCFWN